MITFSFPDDEVLAALGRVTIAHGHHEYILKMTIKSLFDYSIDEALSATDKKAIVKLRKKIENKAMEKLGRCTALDELKRFLARSWSVSDRRNLYVHNLWAGELDGPILLRNNNNSWEPAPSKDVLYALSQEILEINNELNLSRLVGVIFEALEAKKTRVDA